MARKDQFLFYLQSVRDGELLDELGVEITEAVRAARRTGKEAKLKLTLTVKAHGESVSIGDSVETKLPREAKAFTVMFQGEDGSLSRRNPRQPELDLHGLEDEPPDELKRVD